MQQFKCFFSRFAAEDENPIVFGSNVPRRMFPLHTAPDRLGIEMGLRGVPHRGPDTYQSHPVSY